MFYFFNKNYYLDNIFDLIEKQQTPKIIFCDYNVLINQNETLNENTSMFHDYFYKFLTNEYTLEFLVFSDKYTPKNMEDGFVINNLIDSIYSQSIFNINFFKEKKHDIDRINNIFKINKEQNDFIYSLCKDDFYYKPYNTPLDIFLLFSSAIEVMDFVLRFKIPKNVHIILYNTSFNCLREYEKKIFEFINNILQNKKE